jgi:uncharacterized protein (TIGR02145 family)
MKKVFTFIIVLSYMQLFHSQQTGTFTDKKDGKTYKTVLMQTGRKSGSQTWLAENLVATKFKNGETITEAKSPEEWMSLFQQGKPAWSYPDYNPDYLKYGILYNWYAVIDKRGLAPDGFRVASNEDWTIMQHYESYKDFTTIHDHAIEYSAEISCFQNPPGIIFNNLISDDWTNYLLDFSNAIEEGKNSSGYRKYDFQTFDKQKYIERYDRNNFTFNSESKNSTGFSALPNFQICGSGFTIPDVHEARWWAIKDNKFDGGVSLSGNQFWLNVYLEKENDKLKNISDCGYPVRCVKN